ncbi:prepilin-type N-terminal cleavage/methylation domain-containing protein, partial [Methylophaga sp.]
MKDNEKGFSLTEVMVAAGLLGVLGVVINFGTQQVGKMKKESMQQKV